MLPGGIPNEQFYVYSDSHSVTLPVSGPSTSNHHITKSSIELNCYLFNACSIINKLPELELLLRVNMPAVVGICETHAYPEIPDELICPSGYNIFRKVTNLVAKLLC